VSLGFTPQLMSRYCDDRNPKVFSGAKLVLLAEREPEVFKALQVGLGALAIQRRLGGAIDLREVTMLMGADCGECLREVAEDLRDGTLDEREEPRVEACARKVIRRGEQALDAVAANRAARLARGSKG
jgi:bacterioferritin-associated ferredoxin